MCFINLEVFSMAVAMGSMMAMMRRMCHGKKFLAAMLPRAW